jgi:putative membrane-bound dehydrogenase-like protein
MGSGLMMSFCSDAFTGNSTALGNLATRRGIAKVCALLWIHTPAMKQPSFVLAVTIATALPLVAQKPNANVEARYGLEKAKANMGTFKTPDGLTASLVAAEPDVVNPTSIDVDHRGRVWAVECVNYRRYGKIRPEGDRVIILEDKNGDGVTDESKVFFQDKELTNPLGVCVLPQEKGTKVIVSAAPNVWLLTDADGDDKAEDAKIILKTTGVWDYDHQVHSFVFGPDGKFYFNTGDAATGVTWPDGSPVVDLAGNKVTNKGEPYRKGLVYRCDIDLESGKVSNFETLGHNFRNNYEVAVDSFGTLWQSDNDDDGNKGVRINYVMEFGNYGYTDELTGAGWSSKRTNMETEIPLRHWYQNDPGVVPNLLQTGAGSPTGMTINEGGTLGAQFQNVMIHCDAGPRTTRAYPVKTEGAGYRAEMLDILTSSDSWYRVSDCAIAPDGTLVIADWYDPGVGGHAMGDNEPGKMMGRIYRVSSSHVPKVAPVDVSTPEGATRALLSPNFATRYMAWSALHRMGKTAQPELEKLFKADDARIRARALALLAQIKGNEVKALAAGLGDKDENVSVAAVRLCVTMHKTRGLDTTPLDSDQALVGRLIKDTPAVRRQIAIALHEEKDIAKLWAALAVQHDGKDRWYLEALGIGSAKNEDACFDAWLAMVGDKWNTPGGRDIVWRTRSSKAAGFLAKLLQDKEHAHLRYMRSFDFLPKNNARTDALVEIATSGKASDEIAREALSRLKGTNNDAVAKAITAAMEKARGTAAYIELARDFGVKGNGAELLATALKLGGDPIVGEAVRMVMNDPQADAIVRKALEGGNAPAVLNLLASSGSKRALAGVAALVTDIPAPALAKDAVAALSRTQSGAELLVKIAKDGKFPESLKLAAAGAFSAVQYPGLAADIAAHFPMPGAQGGKPLPPIAELVKLTGNIDKGRAIFERTESTCITCHTAGGKGVDVGPGLSEIGTKLPKEALYESILNPNSGLSMGFETQIFTLRDGGVASGIVRSETKDQITVVLPGGATQSVPKNNIAKREKLTTSLMPAGLSNVLSQDDLVNLVEYLASLKKK